MITQWLWLLVLLAGVGIWLDMSRQRDLALVAARQLCAYHYVQLLDETVSLQRLRIVRRHGQLKLMRYYRFEISSTGNNRQPGTLWMLDGRMLGAIGEWIQDEPPAKLR